MSLPTPPALFWINLPWLLLLGTVVMDVVGVAVQGEHMKLASVIIVGVEITLLTSVETSLEN